MIFGIIFVMGVCAAAPTGQAPTAGPTHDPAQVQVELRYRILNAALESLRLCEIDAYDQYKMDRFQDADILVPTTFSLPGIPKIRSSFAHRFAMNESAILRLHMFNLEAFRQLMVFVSLDEQQSDSPTDFGQKFSLIIARLNRVVANIESILSSVFPNESAPTSPSVTMETENNEVLRYVRDLYVLQEMYSYLPLAGWDFWERLRRHSLQAGSL